MKSRLITLALLTGMLCGSAVEAARRPTKAGSMKRANIALDALFNAIEAADIMEVERLLQEEKIREALNEHSETFSPLGKVHDEIEKNKTSSLSKSEKMARTKRLKKIQHMLQDNGAVLIYCQAPMNHSQPMMIEESSILAVK